MADVYFNPTEVAAVISKVKASYKNLETKVNDMVTKTSSENINGFWTSKEQEKFSSGVEKLNGMITEFNKKYNNFLTLIDSVVLTYGNEKSAILAALEKELSKSESNKV